MHPVRRTHDRGSATVEIAVLGPALLLLVFTVVQVALWAYARNLALAAAQEGASAATSYGGQLRDGTIRAQRFLARSAGDSLSQTAVTVSRVGPDRVRVEVRGRALSVLPGVAGLTVTQSAESTVERFVPDGAA